MFDTNYPDIIADNLRGGLDEISSKRAPPKLVEVNSHDDAKVSIKTKTAVKETKLQRTLAMSTKSKDEFRLAKKMINVANRKLEKGKNSKPSTQSNYGIIKL